MGSRGLNTKEQEALARIKKFVTRTRGLIEELSAEDLTEKGGVNPYMAKALGMKTIDDVVEFFVNRRVERSLGTSFGNVLNDVIKILLGGLKGSSLVQKYGNWIRWWDIVLLDRKAVISVKSGPADMDKDQVVYFAQRATEAKEKGFHPFLVFAYGKQAFPLIEGYLRKEGFDPEKHLLIGKTVFEHFLASPEHYKDVLNLFSIAGAEAGDIFELIEKKIIVLTNELKKKYNNDVNRMLEDMF
jgi:hypothetical protein